MADWRLAPAIKAALHEADRRWPNRKRGHDGTIGDTAHSTRKSDHNPAVDGYVYAFDLTHDPASGCDAHRLVRAAVARRDPRIKYAISKGRIWSDVRAAEGWRPYSGSNRHDKHAHVSILRVGRDDTSPWWPTATAPPKPAEDDEMTPSDWQRLEQVMTKIVDDRVRVILRGERADGTPSGHPDNLRSIRADLAKLIGDDR